MNAPLPNLGGEHGTKPVPPEKHRLVADVDATIEQQTLELPQRKRIADIHHYREANNLGRTVETTEGVLHRCKLRNSPARLKMS